MLEVLARKLERDRRFSGGYMNNMQKKYSLKDIQNISA
jgi:hypothetical protein